MLLKLLLKPFLVTPSWIFFRDNGKSEMIHKVQILVLCWQVGCDSSVKEKVGIPWQSYQIRNTCIKGRIGGL